MGRSDRERAVQAITQRNDLRKSAAQTEKALENIDAEIQTARAQRHLARECDLIAERDLLRKTVTETEAAIKNATEILEVVKAAHKQYEEIIRCRNAEALARYRGGGPSGPAAA